MKTQVQTSRDTKVSLLYLLYSRDLSAFSPPIQVPISLAAPSPLMAPWTCSDSSFLPLRLGASEQPPPSCNVASNQPEAASSQPANRDGFNAWRAKVRSLTPQQRRQFLAHKHVNLAS
jgi:hypothetical protein